MGILDTIRLKMSVRLPGVSLSSLSKGEGQVPLFRQPDEDRKAALAKAVDAINDKFGEHTGDLSVELLRGERPAGHFSRVAAGRGEKERRVGGLPCRAGWRGKPLV